MTTPTKDPAVQKPDSAPDWALYAAEEIRNSPTGTADVLLALFDTGPADKEACERIIVEKFAEIIRKHSPLAGIADLQAARKALEAVLAWDSAETEHDRDEMVEAVRASLAALTPKEPQSR